MKPIAPIGTKVDSLLDCLVLPVGHGPPEEQNVGRMPSCRRNGRRP